MTTVDDLTAYYKNLLIKQYHDKTKAMGTVDTLVRNTLADWVYEDVRDAFDVETAVGVQLDTLAKYVGLIRGSLLVQTDDNLRFLLKMKIIQNISDHTYKTIDDYMVVYFSDVVEIYDNLNMTIDFYFPLTIIDTMVQAYAINALPRPLGVGILLWAIFNPNGDFGYSFGAAGASDPFINGYGYQTYEGGTFIKYIWMSP